jgi:hypothetical protein
MSPGTVLRKSVRQCARRSQHTIKSHHRPEPSVESENELIEIALYVLRTDPVVCSQEPRIEVPEDDMDHREMLVRLGLITLDRHGYMPIAQIVQVIVASLSVGSRLRSRLHVGQDERF